MGKRGHHFWKISIAKTKVGGSFSLQNVSRNSFQILTSYFPAEIAISSKPHVRSVPAALFNGGLWCVLLCLPFPAITELAQSPECFGEEFPAALASSTWEMVLIPAAFHSALHQELHQLLSYLGFLRTFHKTAEGMKILWVLWEWLSRKKWGGCFLF